jgi:hypothetical protein
MPERLISRARFRVHDVSAIYLRHGTTFVAMREREYEAEKVLQALIAEHPEVLADGSDHAAIYADVDL